MRLNFYLEIAGLLIGMILCFATCGQYKMLDLKAKIYVNMVRVTTVLLGCNLLSYMIVKNNISDLIGIAEIIICISFLLMVWILTRLNHYLLESIHGNNSISYRTYLWVDFPFYIDLIMIFVNWGTRSIFDVTMVDESMQIVFNTWYKIPYALAFISFIFYIGNVIVYRDVLKEKQQRVLFLISIPLVIFYYLQYQFKSIAILGFGYSIVLLLIYVYSYNRDVKIDGLTRLPDGVSFKKMLDYRIGQKQNMTIAMITLDDFKQVNREYGYHNGNRYLQIIADYLKSKAPKQCMARYGGDKFAVLFDERLCQDIIPWCDEILERFEHSWELGKLRHKLSVCITLVDYPNLAGTSEEILDLLEYMNAYGKQNKRNQYIICNDEFKERMQRRFRITSILNDVVQGGKIYAEYQPILEVAEDAFTRAEALFRLKDDELGYISPAEFFPIAEENGYIIDIGYVLLEKVCQYMKTFMERGERLPIISVNFYRQQIMAEDIEERVSEILKKYEIAPENIAFELPESVFAVQYHAVKEQMIKLHDMGCRFYLDGFGNAFLDLAHLMELPFELIKINKNMIKEAEHNDSIYLLVSALTAVFEENGKLILGDGIESEHLKEIADLLFLDYLQGYYLCEPVSEGVAREEFRKSNVFGYNENIIKEENDGF